LPDPLAKGGRTLANIYGDIEHFPDNHSYQFCLRLLDLIVQSTQDITYGTGVVILHEYYLPTNNPFKLLTIEAFEEKAPIVRKYLRLDQQNIRDRQVKDFHSIYSFI
jgi:hypothetical protein